jgi:hypothetical protein
VITPSAAVGRAGSSSSGSRPSAAASIPCSWTDPGSKEQRQPLPGIQLPPAVLALDPLGAAHLGLPSP